MKSFEFSEYTFTSELVGSRSLVFSDVSGYEGRYIHDMRLRIGLSNGSNDNYKVKAMAKDSDGKYDVHNPLLTYSGESSNLVFITASLLAQDYSSSTDSMTWAREQALNALKYGFYLWKVYGNIWSTQPATLYLDTYQGVITPEGSKYTSGSLQKGGKYTLEWTTDAEDSFESQNCNIYLDVRYSDGSGLQTYHLNNGATSYTLDTSSWMNGSGIQWRVRAVAYASNSEAASEWYTLTLADAGGSVTDLQPSSTTYYGFNRLFSWAFSGDNVALQQRSAVVQYRNANTTSPVALGTVNGSTKSITIDCSQIPVGSYEWRVIVTSNYGSTYTSSWISCNNTQIAPKGSKYTSGKIERGGQYVLEWTVDAKGNPDIDGCKTYVDIQWSDGTNGKSVQLSTGATSYTLNTSDWMDTSHTALRWRARLVVNGTGTSLPSDWYTLTLNDAGGTISDMRPTDSTYYGFRHLFSWAFSGDSVALQQQSAVVQYRTTNIVTPVQIASVSTSDTFVYVDCSQIPVGSYEWRVVITSNYGSTYTSSWVSCKNIEVVPTITDLSPAADGYAPRAIENRFSWRFSVDGDTPGEIEQQSAVFRWRATGSSYWHAISVSGNQLYCTVPANTFPSSGSSIDWYVTATASTGTVATSEVVTVTTKDARSTATAISPSGIYADDSVEGITFTWQHSIETGTKQCGWEISYSQDSGASYTVLASADTYAQTYTSNPGTFVSGTIYWRVRTKNTDGVFGDYSGVAVFAVRRAPAAPVITYHTNKPLAELRWQSAEQVGYEVEVDGESQGLVYGSEKSWQSNQVLTDGSHTVRVRIVNTFGDQSAWAVATLSIANVPWGEIVAAASPLWAEVEIIWTVGSECVATYVLRDGELIAKANKNARFLHDRNTAGEHIYIVRAFNADGYYIDSAGVKAAPNIPYAAIGLAGGDFWHLMKYKSQRDIYSRSTTRAGNSQQYWGHELPTWHDAGYDTVTSTIQYLYDSIQDAETLRAMRGKEVIYKDCDGHYAAGVFAEISDSASGAAVECTIKIVETEREAVLYDPV